MHLTPDEEAEIARQRSDPPAPNMVSIGYIRLLRNGHSQVLIAWDRPRQRENAIRTDIPDTHTQP